MAEGAVDFDEIFARLDAIEALDLESRQDRAEVLAAEQLVLAETVLEAWISAHDGVPTDDKKEGFRLLALHRQGAKGDPSFNACRESCREAVYQHNVIVSADTAEAREKALKMMTMVVRHVGLFVSGKLQVAGLGEFCCASKPLRLNEGTMPAVQSN